MCQNITDSKEDFVRHIKTEHWEDVDDDVMNTLTTDLRKAQRKAELAAKEATQAAKHKSSIILQLPLTNENI